MKQFFKINTLFLLVVLLISSVSCEKENVNSKSKNSYLTEIIKEQHFSKAEIIAGLDAEFPGLNIGSSFLAFFIYDVDIAVINYNTIDVDGTPIVASGVVAMISGTTDYNHLLSIQHGTLDIEEAPSSKLFYYEMIPVMNNHIVVMADYLGYGTTLNANRQHPYLHNESMGRVCVDMIEAAREYLAEKKINELVDKVELIGYSQGANSTIATVYEMEKRNQGSRIRTVHVGGGAYDLPGTLAYLTSGGIGNYPRMGYIPYIIRGLSYGHCIALDDSKIYSPVLIENGFVKIFNELPLSQWHDRLGTDIRAVLHPDFFEPPTYNGNTEILTLMDMVKENSLVERDAPKTAVRLYHSATDDFVPYSNATAAKHKWKNATLTNLNSMGHAEAFMEFILRYMGLWQMMPPGIK